MQRIHPGILIRCLLGAGFFGAIGIACGGSVGPDKPDVRAIDIVMTAVSSPAELVIVDGAGRNIASRIDLGGAVEGLTAAPDGSTFYVGIVGSGFRRMLVALDGITGKTLYALPLSENGLPIVVDGIGLLSGEVVAVSADNSRLYVGRAVKDGVRGIAALDLTTRRPVAFSGPWNVAAGGIVPLAADGTVPLLRDGAVAIVASRQVSPGGGPRTGEKVYFLASSTLAVLDSITTDVLGGSPTQDIWEAVPAPDGRAIYVGGSERVARFDLVTQRVVATVARPSLGAIAVAADGSAVLITDVGSFPDSPGSGLLFVYGPDLVQRGTIDVSTPLGGRSRSPSATVTGIALSRRSGHVLYVRSGTPATGPNFFPQPARLLTVDASELRVLQALELGGFGLGPIALGSR